MSAPKGYPSRKKLQTILDSYSEAQSRVTSEFATLQPSTDDRVGLDTVSRFGVLVASDAVESGSTKRIIVATGHSALVGDYIRYTSAGSNLYCEVGVLSVPNANTIILATELPATPTATDTFDIMRYSTPKLASTGGISTTPGPAQIVLDGVDTEVAIDTTTPANTVAMPVRSWAQWSESARHDYSSVSVTNGAWVELIASTAADTWGLSLFDGGGYAMELGIGASPAEARTLLIPPGGFNGVIDMFIPAGSRLTVQAVGAATVSAGEICINLFK